MTLKYQNRIFKMSLQKGFLMKANDFILTVIKNHLGSH